MPKRMCPKCNKSFMIYNPDVSDIPFCANCGYRKPKIYKKKQENN